MSSAKPLVCVIGAGSSGIATCKVLHERKIPFVCYEKSDRIGGNWVFQNKNGMSAAYRSLHINTSRDRMAYSDFPMPRDYPDFPSHFQIARYFEDYVEHFGFRDRIVFNTGVTKAERGADGVWTITLDDGSSRRFDALAVANGHHWDPRWPEPPFPGQFSGEEMHAHNYTDAEMLRGKRVLVVGMGNSAMDIAVEATAVAERVFLSARRGAYVLPKYIFGKPLDQYPMHPMIPLRIRQLMMGAMFRISVGRVEKYGLPKPDHRIIEAHPTVSDTILSKLTHGDIAVKPNIAEKCGDSVRFTDGSEEKVNLIVYCTGYKVTFPFFDPDFISAPDNDLPLFRRVFKSGIDNLFFIGLLQPLGAVMPLSEAQSEWIADYLEGKYALPEQRAVDADIEGERMHMAKRYVRSVRHTMQVDFDDYLYGLKKERARGAVRARRNGCVLPVPSRAAIADTDQSALPAIR